MAARITAQHHAEVRKRIQTSQLLNRLHDMALGEREPDQARIRAIEILLKKTLPDLSSVTISGDEANPLNAVVRFGWAPPKP